MPRNTTVDFSREGSDEYQVLMANYRVYSMTDKRINYKQLTVILYRCFQFRARARVMYPFEKPCEVCAAGTIRHGLHATIPHTIAIAVFLSCSVLLDSAVHMPQPVAYPISLPRPFYGHSLAGVAATPG